MRNKSFSLHVLFLMKEEKKLEEIQEESLSPQMFIKSRTYNGGQTQHSLEMVR